MIIAFDVLSKGHVYQCFIDAEDVDLLNIKWSIKNSRRTAYLRITTPRPKQRSEKIHRVIMQRMLGRVLLRSEEVDHKDVNGLNNTRQNLRIATRLQQGANQKVRRDNKLGIKGVVQKKNRYQSVITLNGKQIYLGMFDTPELAHAAYLKAAKELFGEFARGE